MQHVSTKGLWLWNACTVYYPPMGATEGLAEKRGGADSIVQWKIFIVEKCSWAPTSEIYIFVEKGVPMGATEGLAEKEGAQIISCSGKYS